MFCLFSQRCNLHMSIHWCCTRNTDCHKLQAVFQKHGAGKTCWVKYFVHRCVLFTTSVVFLWSFLRNFSLRFLNFVCVECVWSNSGAHILWTNKITQSFGTVLWLRFLTLIIIVQFPFLSVFSFLLLGPPICFRCFSWCDKSSGKNWWCF